MALSTKEDQTTHGRLCKGRTITCSLCSETLTSPTAAREHVIGIHGKRFCPVCRRHMKSWLAFKNHVKTHYRPFCPVCQKVLKTLPALKNHVKTHYTPKRPPSVQPQDKGLQQTCSVCGLVATSCHCVLSVEAPGPSPQCSNSSGSVRRYVEVNHGVKTKGKRLFPSASHGLVEPERRSQLSTVTSADSVFFQPLGAEPTESQLVAANEESYNVEGRQTTLEEGTKKNNKSFVCGVCGVNLQQWTNYMEHMAQHNSTKPYLGTTPTSKQQKQQQPTSIQEANSASYEPVRIKESKLETLIQQREKEGHTLAHEMAEKVAPRKPVCGKKSIILKKHGSWDVYYITDNF